MLHLIHGLLVGVGALLVGFLLLPELPNRRRVGELRRAVEAGTVVHRAYARAGSGERPGSPADLGHPNHAREPADRRMAVIAACASVTAAVVHGAVGPEHFREGWRFGVFFIVLGVAQLTFAPLVVRRRSRRLLWWATLANVATVGLWVATRTVGLPFGLADVEPIGRLDVVATVAELVLPGCCTALLVGGGRPAERVSSERILFGQLVVDQEVR